jgi:hypothetical protein
MSQLYVFKNPDQHTRAVKVYNDTSPGTGFEAMSEEEFEAWLQQQPPPLIVSTPEPDWDSFRRLALGSQTIAAAMAAARANSDPDMDAAGVPPGEPAATYLAAAYDAAAAGDLTRLQAVWPVLVVRGGIGPQDREELAQHAEALSMPAALVAILRGP